MGMVGVSFMSVMMLFSGDLVTNPLTAPPRDLATLISAAYALTQAGVAQDEETLIALLGTTKSTTKAPAREADLQQAIADLGAKDLETRKRAIAVLMSAGARARPLLAQAAKSDDPEVRTTATQLLRKLNAAISRTAAKGDIEYVKKLFAIRRQESLKPAICGMQHNKFRTEPLPVSHAQFIQVIAREGEVLGRQFHPMFVVSGAGVLCMETQWPCVADLLQVDEHALDRHQSFR